MSLLFQKTENEWKIVAKGFENRWDYPHEVGAVDGRHIHIALLQELVHISITDLQHGIMAIVNAYCKFTLADFGVVVYQMVVFWNNLHKILYSASVQ